MLDCDSESPEGEVVTFAQVVEVLRKRGSALASLKEYHISAIVQIMINNARLALDFAPGRFHGSLLLFNSTMERGDDTATSDTWQPYVDGTIDTYDIVTRHDHMTRPGSVAQIGPILAAKLEEAACNTSSSQWEG
jgi:thioesterase domain-containing protein